VLKQAYQSECAEELKAKSKKAGTATVADAVPVRANGAGLLDYLETVEVPITWMPTGWLAL
jgi:hypothetical protein